MPKDPNRAAALTVRLATEEPEPETATEERSPVSLYLATIGRKGGIKGGKARAASLTAERKSEIAKRAAQARWADKGKEDVHTRRRGKAPGSGNSK